jgi:hypothetical protein
MLLLASLGLTFILKQGTILNPIRNLLTGIHPKIKELFDCAMCLGFWCGLFVSLGTLHMPIDALILGLSTSFLGFITQHVIMFLCHLYETKK